MVEALASCCIKGAFALKNRCFCCKNVRFYVKNRRFGRGYVHAGAVCLCSVVRVVHIRGVLTCLMCGGCPCCLYLSISGGLVCVEALGSFLVSTFCPFRSYDTPLVSTFCRFLTYENGRRGGRLQTSTGRRTFRAFVLWCGCSFQYTAKPPHVGAFLSCVVHIVHVVHIWRRVWYSLNAAGRPLPENGQKSAINSRNIAEKGANMPFLLCVIL